MPFRVQNNDFQLAGYAANMLEPVLVRAYNNTLKQDYLQGGFSLFTTCDVTKDLVTGETIYFGNYLYGAQKIVMKHGWLNHEGPYNFTVDRARIEGATSIVFGNKSPVRSKIGPKCQPPDDMLQWNHFYNSHIEMTTGTPEQRLTGIYQFYALTYPRKSFIVIDENCTYMDSTFSADTPLSHMAPLPGSVNILRNTLLFNSTSSVDDQARF